MQGTERRLQIKMNEQQEGPPSLTQTQFTDQTGCKLNGKKDNTKGELASILFYFLRLRFEDFREERERLEPLLPVELLWRDFEGGWADFFLCELLEDDDLRLVVAGRWETPAMGFGLLRRNERRNKGGLASGRRGGLPALAREWARSLSSAAAFRL